MKYSTERAKKMVSEGETKLGRPEKYGGLKIRKCVVGPKGMSYCPHCGVMVMLGVGGAKLGRKFSDSTKGKMAESQKRRWDRYRKNREPVKVEV